MLFYTLHNIDINESNFSNLQHFRMTCKLVFLMTWFRQYMCWLVSDDITFLPCFTKIDQMFLQLLQEIHLHTNFMTPQAHMFSHKLLTKLGTNIT